VGRNYSVLFSNMNRSVKKGDKVTIVIGGFKAENLVVEVVEQPVPASGNPVHEVSTTTKTDVVEEGLTNPKNPVEVTAGKKFTIVLDANHTTGYRWELASTLDKSIVELVGSVYEASDTQKVGSGGREVWTFLAKGTGKAKVSFQYVRPWEKQAGPAKTTSFEIIVQ
jgi:predicted secreted protein